MLVTALRLAPFSPGLSIPCGVTWPKKGKSWKLDTITFGKVKMTNLLDPFAGYGDMTPPEIGIVNITQIGNRHVALGFSGFIEKESDIKWTQALVLRNDEYGDLLGCEAFQGAAETWNGALDTVPSHNDKVVLCAWVSNSWNRVAQKCTEPFLWDGAAPEITAFYTVNPFSNQWRVAIGDKLYTNATDRLKFGMRLAENPDGDCDLLFCRPIKSGMWAITTGKKCKSLACPEGKLVAPFAPIGHAERLMKGMLGEYYDEQSRKMRKYSCRRSNSAPLHLTAAPDCCT